MKKYLSKIRKNPILLTLLFCLLGIPVSCIKNSDNRLSGDNWRNWWEQITRDDSRPQIEDICRSLTLTKIKVLLGNVKNNYRYFDKANLYITSCKVKINDLMEIYSYTNDDEIRLLILQSLNITVNLQDSNEKILNFYKTVVKETKDEKVLSEAVQGLAKLKQIDEIVLIYNSIIIVLKSSRLLTRYSLEITQLF
jgi:hypothetical protein